MKHLTPFNENQKMNTNPIFRRKIIYSVECSDLSSLINKVYGKYPEIEASLELGDDDTFEIEANAGEFVNSDQEDEFAKWLVKPSYERSEIYMLMNKLAFDGHIVDGNYLIKTF